MSRPRSNNLEVTLELPVANALGVLAGFPLARAHVVIDECFRQHLARLLAALEQRGGVAQRLREAIGALARVAAHRRRRLDRALDAPQAGAERARDRDVRVDV